MLLSYIVEGFLISHSLHDIDMENYGYDPMRITVKEFLVQGLGGGKYVYVYVYNNLVIRNAEIEVAIRVCMY